MFIRISNYCLRLENIEEFYSCDILGNYKENTGLTFIRFKDGFRGVYFANYCELYELVKKGIEEGYTDPDIIIERAFKESVNKINSDNEDLNEVRAAIKKVTSGDLYDAKGYLTKEGYEALEALEGLDLFWICDPLIKLVSDSANRRANNG